MFILNLTQTGNWYACQQKKNGSYYTNKQIKKTSQRKSLNNAELCDLHNFNTQKRQFFSGSLAWPTGMAFK